MRQAGSHTGPTWKRGGGRQKRFALAMDGLEVPGFPAAYSPEEFARREAPPWLIPGIVPSGLTALFGPTSLQEKDFRCPGRWTEPCYRFGVDWRTTTADQRGVLPGGGAGRGEQESGGVVPEPGSEAGRI